MRADADRDRIERLLTELGKLGSAGDRVYLAGGASATLIGWRQFTQDVDIRIEASASEPLLRAISELKERLDVNVELAGPLDFLPAPLGWQDRSVFLARYGALDVFHTDFTLQAISKLERGLDRDLADVKAMLERGLITVAAVRETFAEMEPELYRFPSVDAGGLREVVAAFAAAHEGEKG